LVFNQEKLMSLNQPRLIPIATSKQSWSLLPSNSGSIH
jgi:hypothetical protein